MTKHVYLPDQTDTQLRPKVENSFGLNWGVRAHYGGQRTLGSIADNELLFLLAHGHEKMPLFTLNHCVVQGEKAKKARRWSAAEMADLLVSDGLPQDHRDLDLQVCHAGQTLGDKSLSREFLSIQSKYTAAQNNAKEMAELQTQYSALLQKSVPSEYIRDGQTFPMCAQLFRELYSRGYRNLRIVAYRAPVRQYWGNPLDDRDGKDGPIIHLEEETPSGGPIPVKTRPGTIMIVTKALFKRFGWSLDVNNKQDRLCVPRSC